MSKTSPSHGQLRVWHIPQVGVPGKPFQREVPDIHEAVRLLNALAAYDLFQYENRIKPDYCNAQGLEVYDSFMEGTEEGPWVEWTSKEGLDLREHICQGDDPLTLVWESTVDPGAFPKRAHISETPEAARQSVAKLCDLHRTVPVRSMSTMTVDEHYRVLDAIKQHALSGESML